MSSPLSRPGPKERAEGVLGERGVIEFCQMGGLLCSKTLPGGFVIKRRSFGEGEGVTQIGGQRGRFQTQEPNTPLTGAYKQLNTRWKHVLPLKEQGGGLSGRLRDVTPSPPVGEGGRFPPRLGGSTQKCSLKWGKKFHESLAGRAVKKPNKLN